MDKLWAPAMCIWASLNLRLSLHPAGHFMPACHPAGQNADMLGIATSRIHLVKRRNCVSSRDLSALPGPRLRHTRRKTLGPNWAKCLRLPLHHGRSLFKLALAAAPTAPGVFSGFNLWAEPRSSSITGSHRPLSRWSAPSSSSAFIIHRLTCCALCTRRSQSNSLHDSLHSSFWNFRSVTFIAAANKVGNLRHAKYQSFSACKNWKTSVATSWCFGFLSGCQLRQIVL